MAELLNDKRFKHLMSDPKFRKIPKKERKVKIDKRFKSMFNDKNFTLQYTVDKRGRPISQTSTENLKAFYDISSSEEESSEEVVATKGLQEKKSAKKKKNSESKTKKNNQAIEPKESENSEEEVDEKLSEENNYNQLKVKRPNDKNLDEKVKTKLRDLTIDYARGEGVLISDSSSGEDSSDFEEDEEEIEHNWGELDKEADTTDEITSRLALCNMDWDKMRASDIMVLFNSFLPTGGLIKSVTIYPSEFGLQRMKEEEIKGPAELVESNRKDDSGNEDDNDEGSNYQMEKLRMYQLNRLKYYYAVIVFDSANTANKVYSECDGFEYESTATKLDLRFIPDEMTFDQEPKEVCDKIPDLTKYQPRQFTTSALQQVKVDLTWDETDPSRQEITQKINSGKFNEIDQNDLQAYLASGTSDDDSGNELKGIDDQEESKKTWAKYFEENKKENKKTSNDVELEFTWGIGEKEKSEKLVKEKMKQSQNLTPFEKLLEKRKEKKKVKREQKKNSLKMDGNNQSDSEDSTPSDVDMNDPYFAEELRNNHQKPKKRKNESKADSQDSCDDEHEKRQAELELLLMSEDEEQNSKQHFSMKKIEEGEILTKAKKKRLSKKKKDLKDQANEDNFEVDVKDPRFNALFTSHHYNIDPADPHYRKTKGTEALINEKLQRKSENLEQYDENQETTQKKTDDKRTKIRADLSLLVESVKRKTKNSQICK